MDIEQAIVQGRAVSLYFYLQRNDGTLAIPTDYDGITVIVTDMTTGVTNEPTEYQPLYTFTDQLVTTDPRCRPTNTRPGYNCEVIVNGYEFAHGEHEYQVEVTFDPIDGQPFTYIRRYWTMPSFGGSPDLFSSSSTADDGESGEGDLIIESSGWNYGEGSASSQSQDDENFQQSVGA